MLHCQDFSFVRKFSWHELGEWRGTGTRPSGHAINVKSSLSEETQKQEGPWAVWLPSVQPSEDWTPLWQEKFLCPVAVPELSDQRCWTELHSMCYSLLKPAQTYWNVFLLSSQKGLHWTYGAIGFSLFTYRRISQDERLKENVFLLSDNSMLHPPPPLAA